MAGSGKSTLVSFIVQNKAAVKEKLGSWAGPQNLVFAWYFFWRHGSFLQKSINGMLRALLIQVLQQVPSVAESLDTDSQQLLHQGISSSVEMPWSQATLTKLLYEAVRSCNGKVCFFIDALDEFHAYDTPDQLNSHQTALHESMDELLDIIEALWNMPNVKVCVASRPGNIFDSLFGNIHALDLERLNETDIHIYARGQLERRLSVKVARNFTRRLVTMSQGIFLWVKLAVQSILEGARNGDSAEDLEKRLHELPVGLEKMYQHMLANLDTRYRDDATQIYHLVELLSPRQLLTNSIPNAMLVFLCRDALKSVNKSIALDRKYMTKILGSRTGGLLTLTVDTRFRNEFRDNTVHHEETKDLAALEIAYVHRTAWEHIWKHLRSQHGTAISSTNCLLPDDVAIIEGSISYLKLLHPARWEDTYNETFVQQYIHALPEFPESSSQIYYTALDLLAKAQTRMTGLGDKEEYLDQLSTIPLMCVNPILFARFGIYNEDSSIRSYQPRSILSHIANFAACGLQSYALAKIAPSGLNRTAELCYLLFFSLFHCAFRGPVVDHLEEKIMELQSIIGRIEDGQLLLNHIWHTLLVWMSRDGCLVLPCEKNTYKLFLRVFERAGILYSESHQLYLVSERFRGFQNLQNVWRVAVSSAVLLYTMAKHFDLEADTIIMRNGFAVLKRTKSPDLADSETESSYLYRTMPPSTWSQGFRITGYCDPWLMLDVSVSSPQSAFIICTDSGAWSSPNCNRFGLVSKRLRWTMLYILLSSTSKISPNISWEEYQSRVKPLARPSPDLDDHEWGHLFIGPRENYFQRRSYARSVEPCAQGCCWDCVCTSSADGCPSPNGGCPCASRRSRIHGSDDRINCVVECWGRQCWGCNCVRKLHNLWLRQVLHETELEWDTWYDELLIKYGRREKAFEKSKTDDFTC